MSSHAEKRSYEESVQKEEETPRNGSDNTSNSEPDRKVKKLDVKSDSADLCQTEQKSSEEGKSTENSTCQGSSPGKFVEADELVAQAGDLIEIRRGFYSHWALYASDGMVIHVTGDHSDISVVEAQCRKNKLTEVAGESLVRVNNLEKEAAARKLKALDPETILKNVEQNLEKMLPYNVFSRNCEHYVTEWRYGQGWSQQADTGLSLLSAISNTTSKTTQNTDTATKDSAEKEGSNKTEDGAKDIMDPLKDLATQNPAVVNMLLSMMSGAKDTGSS